MTVTKFTPRILAGLAFVTVAATTAQAQLEWGPDCNIEKQTDWQCPHDYYDPTWRRLRNTVDDYHLHQGRNGMFKKDYPQAHKDLAFILHYFPNHPHALELMGELSILMGKPEEADNRYRKAFESYPNAVHAPHYSGYAKFLINTGRYKDAIEAGKKAIGESPDLPEAHYHLGRAYLALGDYERANAHAQKAYSKNYPLTDLREKLIAAKAWKP